MPGIPSASSQLVIPQRGGLGDNQCWIVKRKTHPLRGKLSPDLCLVKDRVAQSLKDFNFVFPLPSEGLRKELI